MDVKNVYLKKKYLKKVVGILVALFVFFLIKGGANCMYTTSDKWSRILWHHFYEDRGKIDNVYIGSSHVYRNLDPKQFDEINGQYNFNLASSGQLMNGSYYCLKEADRNNSLSNVYLEIYYMCCTKDNFNSDLDPIDTAYDKNWINTDYMENSINKLEYMLSISGPDRYMNIFFPFSRYRGKLGDWDYITQTLDEKKDSDYLAYKFHDELEDGNGYEEYLKQGYLYSSRVYSDAARRIIQNRDFEEDPLGEKSEKYLRKFINYCLEHNLPLTLFISPIDDLQLISTQNYDNFTNRIKQIADEYGIAFYDFNLAKEEYFPIHHNENFRDVHHLNNEGVSIFTSFFSEVVSGEPVENEQYFYASYKEKLQTEPPAIYGLYYRDSHYTNIASNREEGMEYKVVLKPTDREEYPVQDFSENKVFSIPSEEKGICVITARMKDDPAEVQTLEIGY